MYSITVVINNGEADIFKMIEIKDDDFPHVKYLEALKGAEELFDRHVITSYIVTLYKYNEGKGNNAEQLILKHSRKANIH